MKLSDDVRIAPEKLTQYLLTPKKRNDKSKWLAEAGYTLENWQKLENDHPITGHMNSFGWRDDEWALAKPVSSPDR